MVCQDSASCPPPAPAPPLHPLAVQVVVHPCELPGSDVGRRAAPSAVLLPPALRPDPAARGRPGEVGKAQMVSFGTGLLNIDTYVCVLCRKLFFFNLARNETGTLFALLGLASLLTVFSRWGCGQLPVIFVLGGRHATVPYIHAFIQYLFWLFFFAGVGVNNKEAEDMWQIFACFLPQFPGVRTPIWMRAVSTNG